MRQMAVGRSLAFLTHKVSPLVAALSLPFHLMVKRCISF
jgi:hypothetical protein